MRRVYVWDRARGMSVDKRTGEPMVDRAGPINTPMVVPDTPGYQSPIDGKWVEGRRARRYDMESNDCVDANDLGDMKGTLKNERFAKKWGLEDRLER